MAPKSPMTAQDGPETTSEALQIVTRLFRETAVGGRLWPEQAPEASRGRPGGPQKAPRKPEQLLRGPQ
eukprot:4850768-Pyramimonas_sp.AAC.1